jgi:hypothetical protein
MLLRKHTLKEQCLRCNEGQTDYHQSRISIKVSQAKSGQMFTIQII